MHTYSTQLEAREEKEKKRQLARDYCFIFINAAA